VLEDFTTGRVADLYGLLRLLLSPIPHGANDNVFVISARNWSDIEVSLEAAQSGSGRHMIPGPAEPGAPHTDWISVRSLRKYCGKFSSFSAKIENIDQEPPFRGTPREDLLKTKWPNTVGLDLYATAVK
jgi:hypothetical protein